MRISDWSSDVCSSDLDLDFGLGHVVDRVLGAAANLGVALLTAVAVDVAGRHAMPAQRRQRLAHLVQPVRLADRRRVPHGSSLPENPLHPKSVGEGKGGSGRVGRGGSRVVKKKKITNKR